jgi:hypothetical protein
VFVVAVCSLIHSLFLATHLSRPSITAVLHSPSRVHPSSIASVVLSLERAKISLARVPCRFASTPGAPFWPGQERFTLDPPVSPTSRCLLPEHSLSVPVPVTCHQQRYRAAFRPPAPKRHRHQERGATPPHCDRGCPDIAAASLQRASLLPPNIRTACHRLPKHPLYSASRLSTLVRPRPGV